MFCRRITLLGLVVLMAAFVPACSSDSDTNCPACEDTSSPPSLDTSADGKSGMPCMPPCMGGEICVDSVCSISTPPPTGCTDDSQCANGETCVAGSCVPSTTPPEINCDDMTWEECAAATCASEDKTEECDCLNSLWPGLCSFQPKVDNDCVCPAEATDENCYELAVCAYQNGLAPAGCNSCYTDEGAQTEGIEFCEECAQCDAFDAIAKEALGTNPEDGEGGQPGFAPGNPPICTGNKTIWKETIDIEIGLNAKLLFFNLEGSVSFAGVKERGHQENFCHNWPDSPTVKKADGTCESVEGTWLECSRECLVCSTVTAKGNVVVVVGGGGQIEKTDCGSGSTGTAQITLVQGTPTTNMEGQCDKYFDANPATTWDKLCSDAQDRFNEKASAIYNPNCGNKADGDAWCEKDDNGTFHDGHTNARCILVDTGSEGKVEDRFGECQHFAVLHKNCPGDGSKSTVPNYPLPVFEYPCDKGLFCKITPESPANCGTGIWQTYCEYTCEDDGSGTYEGKQ